jgi:hypothetical protein
MSKDKTLKIAGGIAVGLIYGELFGALWFCIFAIEQAHEMMVKE